LPEPITTDDVQRTSAHTLGTDHSSSESVPPPHPTIPGYQILDILGHGGMGVVYKARHLQLNRLVALKMVLAGKQARPSELLRFRIEAEAVAALAHPNIVPVHEVGEADNCPYLALEYVDGGTLALRLQDRPFVARQAAEMVR
jgi:serine/threonine-protein kinase